MAKQKTKLGPIETLCTEIRPGVWEFKAGRHYLWQYDSQARQGLNLAVARQDNPGKKWSDILWVKNLDGAVYYAHGFETGADAKRLGVVE